MSDTSTSFDPMFPNRPWTVCFYSFRGGVGRTTLAVNTAINLAKPDTGVFILDFDLAAPGIDDFRRLAPPDSDQKGLVEFANGYRKSGHSPDLKEFIYPVGDKRYVNVTPDEHKLRCLAEPELMQLEDLPYHEMYVMRAGRRDQAYRKFLAQHDWEHFYRFEDGYLFFENLRAGACQEFGCSYMIVDSRTGLTDIGSVCTGHLADAVVLVFQPTTAHVAGLCDVVRAIRDREQREQRPISRLYVASKVPEIHEDEFDPKAIKVVQATAKLCEGSSAVEEVPPDWAMDDSSVNFRELTRSPALVHYLRQRERVSNSHIPDSFLVEPVGTLTLSELESEYIFVNHWIKESRSSYEEQLSYRNERREAQREAVEFFAKGTSDRIEEILREKPDAAEQLRDLLRDAPKELLDQLPPERRVIVLELLRGNGSEEE